MNIQICKVADILKFGLYNTIKGSNRMVRAFFTLEMWQLCVWNQNDELNSHFPIKKPEPYD
jgi:hypothetical protein